MTETELLELQTATKAALLAAMTNPKPSYSAGEYSVNHDAYVASLRSTLDWITAELKKLPCEETTLFRDA